MCDKDSQAIPWSRLVGASAEIVFFKDTPAYSQLSNLCDQRVGRYFADLVAWVRWESPEKVFLRRKNGGDIPFFSPKVVYGGPTVWTFWKFVDRESSTF